MKLEFPEIDVKTSAKFTSAKFGIGDTRVILDILRHKMYADPISSVCREVMSNSRDANREAGLGDTPIVVKLPNNFEDNISFCDSGPGITPDRMENVFIKYGNSTKRGDNIQTGGFGLGAKTPFAVTDTFTVVTVTEENGVRHKRTYVAYIDNSRYGAMSLVGEEETDEATGTSITMAVKKKDRGTFEEAVRYVGSYFKVRPTVKGYQGDWVWTEEEEVLSNSVDNWKLVGYGSPLVIIDGVAYKVRTKPLFAGYDDDKSVDDAKTVMNSPVRLYFDVGELAVTATREDLDYSEVTIKKIHDVANKMVEHLRTKVADAISGCKSLWDATVKWNEVGKSYSRFVIKPKWNGMSLSTNRVIRLGYNSKLGLNTDCYGKITVYVYDDATDKVSTSKVGWRQKSIEREIPIKNEYLLVEQDELDATPNKMRLRTLFKLGAQKIGLVQMKDRYGDGGKEARKFFEDEYNWSHLGAVKLSTILKTKNPLKVRGKIVIHKVKKLNSRNGRGGIVYEWKPEGTKTAQDSQGGVYVIIHGGKITMSDGTIISKHSLASLETELGETVYGMLYKWRKNINPAWVDVLTHVKAKIVKIEASQGFNDYVKYGYDSRASAIIGHKDYKLVKDMVWKKHNIFKEWIDISKKVGAGAADYSTAKVLRRAAHMSNVAKANHSVLSKLLIKVKEKYPLVFRAVNTYSGVGKAIVAEWVFYIEAKN